MSETYGKGLDVGTSRLVAMWREGDNPNPVKNDFRDCYLELADEDMEFIKSQGKMKLACINDRYFALGEDALVIANLLKQTVKRPMAKGILNPVDDDAYDILEELIGKILGEPRYPGEVCVASIPADSSDGEISTIIHKSAVKQIIQKLGYTFKPINEGFATLLALGPTAEKDGETIPFTGIALSFGGGMCNLCLAYRSKEIKTLSTAESGDWVDENVARGFVNVKPNQVTKFKEDYFKFGKVYTDAEIEAFGYKTPERKKYFKKMMMTLEQIYENLIENTINNFTTLLAGEDIDVPLEIVISGGTSSPEGFEKKFEEVLREMEDEFPIQISNVRKSNDTLVSTATGALVWAMNHERKKQAASGTVKEAPVTPEVTETPES